MELTAVRHGETEENRNKIIQGQAHGKLSSDGLKQVEIVAKELSRESFDVIYSSDLHRCIATAQCIHAYHPGTPLQYDTMLREISFGAYQGQPSDSVDWESLPGSRLTRKVPDGESWQDLSQRIVFLLNNIYPKHSHDKVLIVTHGGPMRVIRSFLGNAALEDLIDERIPNCAVWRFSMASPIENEQAQ